MREPVLEIDRLTAYNRTDPAFLLFGRQTVAAVRDVSLALAPGECLAVLGESGAGKSTLLRVAAGRQGAGAGTIRLLGRDVTGRPDERIQYVPQDPRDALDLHSPLGGQVAGAARDRLERSLSELGLGPGFLERRAATCSGGQIQRMALALCLARAPLVLVLDEPASGVDPHTADQILQALRLALRRDGCSLLVATHDLRLARRLAHRAAVLLDGRLVEEGPVAAVLAAPRHPHTRQLFGLAPAVPAADRNLAGAADAGCPFADRCPEGLPACRAESPGLRERSPGHRVACHRSD